MLDDFCGWPQLYWTVVQAREAETVTGVYVCSDDDEILAAAARFGAAALPDETGLPLYEWASEPALERMAEAVGRLEKGRPDLLVLLNANTPLRRSEDIDRAVNQLLAEDADCLFSASLLDGSRIRNAGEMKPEALWPAGVCCLDSGSMYVVRPGTPTRDKACRTSVYPRPLWAALDAGPDGDPDVCRLLFKEKFLNKPGYDDRLAPLEKASIDLAVYDFDGVMTDNRVLVLQDGTEGVLANRADGLGVGRMRKLGIRQIILSTETNPVVRARAGKLKLEVIDSCSDKRSALIDFCTANGYDLRRVLYIGNDLNDLEAMQAVGMPVAPADAHPAIKALARRITRAGGGEGVIKELSESISD